MKELIEFISRERERFGDLHNNTFAFAFAKIVRYWGFLEIVQLRYHEASRAFMEDTERVMEIARKNPGERILSPEEVADRHKAVELSSRLHLEIESFFLFAKILLDHVARALEYYFGQARGLALDSHDDLTKRLESFALERQLSAPSLELLETVKSLKICVSDYRDSQISHEKSPRTTQGTVWSGDKKARMMSNRIMPKEKESQAESADIDKVLELIKDYLQKLIIYIESNHDKTNLKISS